jgi:RNA polymerase sigma factor for flagellar operon FliA
MGLTSSMAVKEAYSDQGSQERDEALLLAHLPTVRFLSHQLLKRLPHYVEIDDLYSAGIVGLTDAITRFDEHKGIEFRSYAQLRVRGAMIDFLRSSDWAPSELRRKGRAVAEAARLVSHRTGHTPDECEIAEELHISLTAYQALANELDSIEVKSLYTAADDIEEDPFERIVDKRDEGPLVQCLKGELRQHLEDDLKVLPEQERKVLTLYYYHELSMKEVGKILGVGEARVSQIHSSAILRLRVALAGLRTTTRARARQKLLVMPIRPRADAR